MSAQEQPRERTNTSIRVREAYNWDPKEMAKKTRLSYRQVLRREKWDEEKGDWKQKVEGEALTLHEIMLAAHSAGVGWLVQKVTSGDYSAASLRQELAERGGDLVLKLKEVLIVIREITAQLKATPGEKSFWMNTTISSLKTAESHLVEEIERIDPGAFDDEDELSTSNERPPDS